MIPFPSGSRQIGKYEVTAGQYTAFLNAVAKNDPYGLYNSAMAVTAPTDPNNGCGITRTGSPYSYEYSLPPDPTNQHNWPNRPVNFVSWGDAARFANWLHNGQPGISQPIILTGNWVLDAPFTEDGAYEMRGATGGWHAVTRKGGAKWFIPSENEWYKAAYYDPNKPGGPGYWGYPTRVDTPSIPGRDLTETTNPGNNANYWGEPYPIEPGHYFTKAGQFFLSHSAYGTFDQGGNVSEWNESRNLTLDEFGFFRVIRGGSFADPVGYMHATWRTGDWANYEHYKLGFRVGSSVPEPGSVAMLFGVVVMALVYWWRRHA